MAKTFFPFTEYLNKKLTRMVEAIVSTHFQNQRKHIDCVNCVTHFLCAQYHRYFGYRNLPVSDLPFVYAGAILHDINVSTADEAPAPAKAPKGMAALDWIARECALTEGERAILQNICMRNRSQTPLEHQPIYAQMVELAEVYTSLAIDPQTPLSLEETLKAIESGAHGTFSPDLLSCLSGLETEFRALQDCANNHRRILLLQKIYRGDCRHYWQMKRILDVIISFSALLVLSPVLLLICLLIVLDDPHCGPFFKQLRVGRHKQQFCMYKFRTMYKDAEARRAELEKMNEKDGPVFKIANDPRVTRVGRFLRKCSLDELPQLINVLKGEMTLVGPRPPLPKEVDRYSHYDTMRLSVTPGLTCVWQIQPNRDSIRFNRWVDLDLAYIGSRSLKLDFWLIFKTIHVMFSQSGS